MNFLCKAAVTFLVMVIAVDADARKRCSSNDDCPVNSPVCMNGFCYTKASCDRNSDCPPNYPDCSSRGYCHKGCSTNNDCASGYTCEASSCLKYCKTHSDCPRPEKCNSKHGGFCYAPRPCKKDADCPLDMSICTIFGRCDFPILECTWKGTAPFCTSSACTWPGWLQFSSNSYAKCGDGACCWIGHKRKCCRVR